ncbi:MAG: hypothetical protein JWO68_369, partial [Actinomycetia bacterium]|nr:hypothetical protein [Actinomycetes bacterium]
VADMAVTLESESAREAHEVDRR